MIWTVLICLSQLVLSQADQQILPLEAHQAILRARQNLNFYKNGNTSNLLELSRHMTPWAFSEKIVTLFGDSNQNLLTASSVSRGCLEEFRRVAEALVNKELWALQFVDSYAKPPSGLLQGNLYWVGDYRECLNTTNQTIKWEAKYCLLSKSSEPSMNDILSLFRFGICIPATCSSQDIADILNLAVDISKIKFNFTADNVQCVDNHKRLDSSALTYIIIVGVWAGFLLLVTLFDVYRAHMKSSSFRNEIREMFGPGRSDSINEAEIERLIENNLVPNTQTESKLYQIITNMSFRTNVKKIFYSSAETNGQLACLHGIRFLSLAWVILAHNSIFMVLMSDNLAIVNDLLKVFSFQIVFNGFFSVDTFFLLSGLLTSYTFMKEFVKRNAKLSAGLIGKYYFHRYYRLTPAYLMVILFSVYITPYIGSGPFFPDNGFEYKGCKANIWTNLLYVNNLFNFNSTCLPISWYLANDMQFHWIALIIIIPLAFGRHILGSLISSSMLVGSTLYIVLTLVYHPGIEIQPMVNDQQNLFFSLIYIKPWARISPFIIGCLLGYLLFRRVNAVRSTLKLNPILNISGWLVALALTFACVFTLYPDMKVMNTVYYPKWFHITYQSLARLLWAVAVAYIIYTCETYNGGMIRDFLTLKIWQPLSRLSYSAYLIHTTVLFYYFNTQDRPMHTSVPNLTYTFVANLVFSYVAAFFVTILFEMPFIGVEKAILK